MHLDGAVGALILPPLATIVIRVSMRSLATAAALVALASGAASAQNLLTNGSFEAPNIVGGSYVLINTGSTSINGWTVMGGASESVQLTPDTYFGLKASEGQQWIDLTGITGYNKGVRSDPVSVILGQSYTISWDVGNYIPFSYATLGVSVNGGAEALYTNTSLATTPTYPMNWMSFSRTWVADAPTLQLDILGRANGALSNDLGIGIDNVSVVQGVLATPEPASLFLLATGLAGLTLLARRKQA